MKYTMSYDEHVALDDGTVLRFRAIRPSDKAALSAGFQRLSAQSRRQRFLSSKNELTDTELGHLTECNGEDHYAIVAARPSEDGGGQEIIGVARFSRIEHDKPVAELAVTVIDDWQRRGVGRRLLERIVTAASERGIEQVSGMALAENQQVRHLLAPHASHFSKHHEDGLIHFTCDVPPAEQPGRLDDLYALFRLVAEGTLLVPLRIGLNPLVHALSLGRRHNTGEESGLRDTG